MSSLEYIVHWFEELPSTNTALKTACANAQAVSGEVYSARLQTAGRGRADRTWRSAHGSGLTFSFSESSSGEVIQDFSVTMATALAVRDLLASLAVESQVKWPNDLLCNMRKICGILAERVATPDGPMLVVGVGLNINLEATEAMALGRPATSIYLESGHRHKPDQVLDQLLTLLTPRLNTWRTGRFEAIKADWTASCALMNEQVSLRERGLVQQGLLRGFGPHGEALLETSPGKLTPVWSGDLAPQDSKPCL